MSVLFLFSHAGGNVWEYTKILAGASQHFRLVPVELPGDASKLMDDLYESLDEYVDYACEYIQNNVCEGEQIYIMGHSFGGFLIYEIARKISVPISGVVVSGCHPYHIYRKPEKNDSTYCSIFGYSRHLPQEIIDLFEPIVANKIEIVDKHCNKYKNTDINEPLDIFTEIIYGVDDDKECSSDEWYKYFNSNMCRITPMNGGHFYWRDDEENYNKLSEILIELKEKSLNES